MKVENYTTDIIQKRIDMLTKKVSILQEENKELKEQNERLREELLITFNNLKNGLKSLNLI